MRAGGSWWVVVGSWLMVGASFIGVYELGYQRGQIAAMEAEVAR